MPLPSGKCNTNCNPCNPFNLLILSEADFQVLASQSKKEVSLFISSLRARLGLDAIHVTVSFATTLCYWCGNENKAFKVNKTNIMQ